MPREDLKKNGAGCGMRRARENGQAPGTFSPIECSGDLGAWAPQTSRVNTHATHQLTTRHPSVTMPRFGASDEGGHQLFSTSEQTSVLMWRS
jgi:hypothetical protein